MNSASGGAAGSALERALQQLAALGGESMSTRLNVRSLYVLLLCKATSRLLGEIFVCVHASEEAGPCSGSGMRLSCSRFSEVEMDMMWCSRDNGVALLLVSCMMYFCVPRLNSYLIHISYLYWGTAWCVCCRAAVPCVFEYMCAAVSLAAM